MVISSRFLYYTLQTTMRAGMPASLTGAVRDELLIYCHYRHRSVIHVGEPSYVRRDGGGDGDSDRGTFADIGDNFVAVANPVGRFGGSDVG